MDQTLLVNITWNDDHWRNNRYINPKAGHNYAKKNVGGESLNFNFNKTNIDTEQFIHGYVQWTNSPVKFVKGGLIIFYTRNTNINKGQIVGIYGKAESFDKAEKHKAIFQKKSYWVNIKGERQFSMLFPFYLDANKYKENSSERLVGRIGFTYKNEDFAKKILYDELIEIAKDGNNETSFNKLLTIYEFYAGEKFKIPFISFDEKQQKELELFYTKNKTKADIINELQNLKETDPEEVTVNRKTYKRDNKTIAQIKILRDFKCQICSTSIIKKDGSKYIEAAHIKPKHQKGRESVDNIILLCPNHHKEFDFGHLEIKSHNTNQIEFSLNGRPYKIILSIK